MSIIKVKRGLEANIGNITLADGELAMTTDTKKLFVGISGVKVCLGGASSLGDMLKSIYDTDNNGIVDNAEALGGEPPNYYLNYNNFINKPSTFPPSAHDHQQLVIPDTRNVSTSPGDYSKKMLIQFKNSSIVGLSGTYCTIVGFRGWSDDSGDTAHEIGFQTDGIIKVRTGTTASGWGSWKTLKGPVTWGDLKGV